MSENSNDKLLTDVMQIYDVANTAARSESLEAHASNVKLRALWQMLGLILNQMKADSDEQARRREQYRVKP